MEININIKSTAKTRGIDSVAYEVEDNITTLGDLIVNLVDIEIDKYENREFKALNQEEINSMVDRGKISFGFRYREHREREQGRKPKIIDRQEAKEVALQAFTDGLFVVFIGRDRISSLDTEISLQRDIEVTIVRLTMLAGRFF